MAPLDINFLIVDDYEPNLNMLTKSLREMGFTGNIASAVDGKEALILINDDSNKFDFFICDFVMPEVNGLGVLVGTRALDLYKNAPFLMLTAEADRNTIMSCIKAGSSNYLMKPWAPESLLEKIHFCWDKHN